MLKNVEYFFFWKTYYLRMSEAKKVPINGRILLVASTIVQTENNFSDILA